MEFSIQKRGGAPCNKEFAIKEKAVRFRVTVSWVHSHIYVRDFHEQFTGPHLVLFSFRRFSRREMKIKETSTSP